MFGLGSLLAGFDLSTVGPALGVVSVGVWLLRLQRVAAYVRLLGFVVVAVGVVLAGGLASDVLAVDGGALQALAGAVVDILDRAFRAVVGASGGA